MCQWRMRKIFASWSSPPARNCRAPRLPNIVFYLAADDIRITGVAIESLARTITPPLGVLSSHFVTPRRNYFRPLVCRASPSPGCVRGSHAAEKARGSRRCPGIARRALAWWPRLIQGYLHGVLRPEAAALRATSAPPLAPGAATLPRRRNPRHADDPIRVAQGEPSQRSEAASGEPWATAG